MLKIVPLSKQCNIQNGTAMLLGGFDGLHLGHRKLLSCAKESGLPVGIMTIIGGKGDKNLFTPIERADIFQNSGIDFMMELPFEEIRNLSPQEFLAILEKNCNPKQFYCGEDFRFGKGAQGTPEMIKSWGQVRVEVQPLLQYNGEKISATTIKDWLSKGDLKTVKLLLGERFFLIGEVKKDRQVGRSIGFPTANILYPENKLPLKQGVYETALCIDGKNYKGITNYGARPTFDNTAVWTETHVCNFFGDLYGKTLKIEFVRYLRDITKFDKIEDLQAQLEDDKRSVMKA